MKTLITLLCCSVAITLQAQPAIQWQKSLGGSSYDYCESIAYNDDGTYVVAGGANSFDMDITAPHGGTDGWVVKLDHGGNVIWQKSYGGSSTDYIYSIKNCPGGYVMSGYSLSNNIDLPGNIGLTDCWVLRTDSDGNILWSKNYGGTNQDYAFDIDPTTDGGFIVAGLTMSDDGDVTGHMLMEDFWVYKLDGDGNLLWQNCLGGNKTDQPYVIRQLSDGNYLAAGSTYSYTGDITDHIGLEDCVLMKIAPDGTLIWAHCYGGSKYENVQDVIENAEGHYVFVGWTNSFDGDISFNHGLAPGSDDIWTVETDTAGNIIQEKCLGGYGYELGHQIRQNPDSSYFIMGTAYDATGDVGAVIGGNDYWVIRADTDFNIIWEDVYGGTSYDIGRCMDITNDNACIIGGKSQSNNVDVTDARGSDDYWVVKLLGDYILMPSEMSICEGDSALINGIYETSPGIYFDTLVSLVYGYDSILEISLNVAPVPDVYFTTVIDSLCQFDDPLELSALPAGGIFSGAGVSGTTFDPSIPGIGVQPVYYTFTSDGGCTVVDTNYIIVTNCLPAFVTDSIYLFICTGDSIYLQNDWQHSSGIYLDTLTAAGGYDSVLITTLVVNPVPAVALDIPAGIICFGDAAFPLTGGTPAGGTYSGDAVTAGFFDPSLAVIGDNIVTYYYADMHNCAGVASDTLRVEICEGIEQENLSRITIAPNPSSGWIHLEGFENISNGTLKIYSSTGAMVETISITAGEEGKDIHLLTKGLYFVMLAENNRVVSIQPVVIN